MRLRAAITVARPGEEVQRLWDEQRPDAVAEADAVVTFDQAPGDRGTEIRVDVESGARGGKLGDLLHRVTGADDLAKLKDALRHFKQRVETGEIPRSDGSPEGERAERKLKQRPAQPVEQVGV